MAAGHRQATARGPAPPPRPGGACDPPTRPGQRHDQCEPSNDGLRDIGAREPVSHLNPPTPARPIWKWRKAETERRRRAAATQPTPDDHATADDLAAVRVDADPDATGPRSQTIRRLLASACAAWRVRPTSVDLYHALRADNPTRRQRSTTTMLILPTPPALRPRRRHRRRPAREGPLQPPDPVRQACQWRHEQRRCDRQAIHGTGNGSQGAAQGLNSPRAAATPPLHLPTRFPERATHDFRSPDDDIHCRPPLTKPTNTARS